MSLTAPAVPPRPYSSQSHRGPGGAPLVSPRPQRVEPGLPANLDRLSYSSPPPPTIIDAYNMPNPPFAGGFAVGPPPPSYDSYPGRPNVGAYNPHHTPSLPMPSAEPPGGRVEDDFNASFNRLSLGTPDTYARQRAISVGPREIAPNGDGRSTPFAPAPAPTMPFLQSQQVGKPELTAPLPTVATLSAALTAIESPSADLASKVSWIRDVLLLVTRTSLPPPSSTDTATFGDTPTGALKIPDPALERLTVQHALPLLLSLPHIPNTASTAQPQLPAPSTVTPANAEALFIHASLLTSGAFPSLLPQNQRIAFREFECAARAGWGAAWYRIGRDYERFGDVARSRDAYEKGAGVSVGGSTQNQQKQEDPGCMYRLAIAHLLGQLSLPRNTATGLRLLARAAVHSSVSAPHPAYVLGLVLLGEGPRLGFWRDNEDGEVDRAGVVPVGKNRMTEGKRWLERSAYLGFAPAQYKLGHCYEFAEPHPPFAFDPLMSVQYYSLASQAGEAEADMALSKWFLCGSDPDAEAGQPPRDGGFAKDEGLAYVFAEKAANKGLVSAEFAMGYYGEVGIGTPKDVFKAVRWYEIAASHGSMDARQRLEAIGPLPPAGPSGPVDAGGLSRSEHDALTQNRLVRKRTQAKQRSGTVDRMQPQMGGQALLENVRQEAARPMGLPTNPRLPPHQRQQPQPQPTTSPPPRQASLGQNPVGALLIPIPGMAGPDGLTPAQQIAMANRPRYSLADPGFTPPSGGPTTTSPRMRPAGANSSPMGSPRVRPSAGGPVPGVGRGGGRVPSGPNDGFNLNGGSPGPGEKKAQSLPPTKYNSFAEMGIQGKAADDKECIIM